MTATGKEDRARRERDLARFASERIAHLSTASPDGRPHIVPFCFVVIGSNLYSIIDDKPKKTHTGLRRLRFDPGNRLTRGPAARHPCWT